MSDMDQSSAPAGARWVRAWLGDSSLMLVTQTLTVIATSLAAILVARTLAPDDWAVFSGFLGLSLALAIVVDFGLGTWLLREFSRLAAAPGVDDRAVVGQTLSGALALNACVGLAILLGGAAWVAVKQPGAATAVALLCLLSYGMLAAVGSAMESYLRSLRELRRVVAVSVVEKLILVVTIGLAAALGAGLTGIGVAYLAAGVTRMTLDVVFSFVRHQLEPRRPTWTLLRTVGSRSAPFALTAASLNVIPRLDTLVLLTLSTTSAAWFAIGDRILGPALLIPATLGSTLYPFLARTGTARTTSWKLAAAMGAGGLAIALVGIVLAPTVIPLVFGEKYEDAVGVAQVMLLLLPLVYATSPLLATAYSRGAERTLVAPVIAITVAGTVAIVAGELLAGPEGAAAGLLARSLLFLAFIGFVASVGSVGGTRAEPLGSAPPA